DRRHLHVIDGPRGKPRGPFSFWANEGAQLFPGLPDWSSDPVRAARVLAHHQSPLVVRHVRELPGDEGPAVRERALAVRIVARPHETVRAEHVSLAETDRILD